jgi:Ser/Thr protein kinase RdoA (MazF antagonist)
MAGVVRRVGENVRRRSGPWTPAVHQVLHHLERVGFRGAPRALGIDEQGREILTFIPGRVVSPRVLDEAGLVRVAGLIRDYHAVMATFSPPADAVWQMDGRDPVGPAELICHNDLAAWNLVVGEQAWVFIDWDLAAPGRRLWDLALAVCSFVPLWPDQTASMDRYRLFCEAYGLAGADARALLDVVVQRTRRMAQVLVDNADREPYASLVRDGHAESWQQVARHVEAQASVWRSQLAPG